MSGTLFTVWKEIIWVTSLTLAFSEEDMKSEIMKLDDVIKIEEAGDRVKESFCETLTRMSNYLL